MNTNLSTRGKRQVLWNKLKEISDNGKLDMCKSRKEVARMVGYTADRERAGYLWVSSMVKSGKLKETMFGIDKRGFMEYEYKLVENPVKTKDLRDDWGNARAKGRVRFNKLKIASLNGELAKAKTRQDLVKLVGYPEADKNAGYAWIRSLINQGHIKEDNMQLLPDGTFRADYSLSGTAPAYRYEKADIVNDNKETKVMPNNLSKRQKGQQKWIKLMEEAERGRLALCRTRKDVAKLAGYKDSETHRGYSWVMNMLTRGHIREKKLGYNDAGVMEYEFSIGAQPNYRLGKKKKIKQEVQPVEQGVIHDIPESTPVTLDKTNQDKPNVVITYGELRIEFNEANADTMREVIMALADKVKGE